MILFLKRISGELTWQIFQSLFVSAPNKRYKIYPSIYSPFYI